MPVLLDQCHVTLELSPSAYPGLSRVLVFQLFELWKPIMTQVWLGFCVQNAVEDPALF